MLFTLIAYLPSDSIGLLDDDSFKYYIIDNDLINLFPLSIQIEANLLGFKLNYTLYQQISFNNKIYKIKSNGFLSRVLFKIRLFKIKFFFSYLDFIQCLLIEMKKKS